MSHIEIDPVLMLNKYRSENTSARQKLGTCRHPSITHAEMGHLRGKSGSTF